MIFLLTPGGPDRRSRQIARALRRCEKAGPGKPRTRLVFKVQRDALVGWTSSVST
ncbi:hypothetical protein [Telmatospirillum siberiense]|uniref:hypothetical protein n=1 Tax=Telmatospirillum siberiense TaxID=382514 RepID=UPI001A7E091F|nr:hypothetical protein [Telmatospirillum siberiense]